LLIFYDGCDLKLSDNDYPAFKNTAHGRIYLTSHRVIFVSKKASSLMSFSMPFVNMKGIQIKQPVLGANRIEGKVYPQQHEPWQGSVTFFLTFNHGGAIEFGKALLQLGKLATSSQHVSGSYQRMPAAADYYACPPPAYAPPFTDPFYHFVPQHDAFTVPPANSLFQYSTPPPYPGAVPVVAPFQPSPSGPMGPPCYSPGPYPAPSYPTNGASFTGVSSNSYPMCPYPGGTISNTHQQASPNYLPVDGASSMTPAQAGN
ncbi:unnamed protein product, partial [Protopolystoma xenopodis]